MADSSDTIEGGGDSEQSEANDHISQYHVERDVELKETNSGDETSSDDEESEPLANPQCEKSAAALIDTGKAQTKLQTDNGEKGLEIKLEIFAECGDKNKVADEKGGKCLSKNSKKKKKTDLQNEGDGNVKATDYVKDKFHNINNEKLSDATTSQELEVERQIDCPICGRSFTRSTNLRAHMLIHTGDRPYTCKVCNKNFIRSSDVKRHMLVHTGERPYSCVLCHQRFALYQNLKTHMDIHSGVKPFKCTFCTKCFSRDRGLKRHMLVHSGDKPHSCEECGKEVTTSHSLKMHKLIHTGEKPYSCPVCSKPFRRSQHVKKHVLTHEKEIDQNFILTTRNCAEATKDTAAMIMHSVQTTEMSTDKAPLNDESNDSSDESKQTCVDSTKLETETFDE